MSARKRKIASLPPIMIATYTDFAVKRTNMLRRWPKHCAEAGVAAGGWGIESIAQELRALGQSHSPDEGFEDLQRISSSVRLTLLKITFDLSHRIGDMGQAQHRGGSRAGEAVESRCF